MTDTASIASRSLASPASANPVWISFLFSFSGVVNGNDFLGLWLNSSTGPNIGLKGNEGGSGTRDLFARTVNGGEGYSTDIMPGQTYLIVGRLRSSGGIYNNFDLWVNPTLAALSGGPDATGTGSSISSILSIGFRGFSLEDGDAVRIDEIRLATTAAEVLALPPAGIVLAASGLITLGLGRRFRLRARGVGTDGAATVHWRHATRSAAPGPRPPAAVGPRPAPRSASTSVGSSRSFTPSV